MLCTEDKYHSWAINVLRQAVQTTLHFNINSPNYKRVMKVCQFDTTRILFLHAQRQNRDRAIKKNAVVAIKAFGMI
jgi:hypothetical protein